jgi:hypothetical protein
MMSWKVISGAPSTTIATRDSGVGAVALVLAAALAASTGAACSTSADTSGGGGEGATAQGHATSHGAGAGAPGETSTGAHPGVTTATTGATSPATTTGATGSTGTGECSGGDPNACAACCESAHGQGATDYSTTLQDCACGGACTSSCQAPCGGAALDQGCIDCLNDALSSGACSSEPCSGDADCGLYESCLESCESSTSTSTSTTATTTTGPTTTTSTGGGGTYDSARQDCVDTINMYRATLGLAPYARWTADETCTDGQAEADGMANSPHSAFGQCGEWAQDECPGWPGTPDTMIEGCLAEMWAEGPGSDFSTHGHYINMSSTQYTKASCGYYVMPDGSVWATQDFQ